MKQLMRITINGVNYEEEIDVRRTLLEVLRENFGLTGTKRACNEGECGVCTVLMDGKPVASCLVLAVEAQGREIETVEGVAEEDELHPLQQAFLEHGAFQCGFCTPGTLMTAKGLLEENPSPTEGEVRHAIAGNLCRCTGYTKYVDAVMDAADKMKK
ncbi:MAG: (2Fe-2S)-binding protein [Deltaproteobacteria bacterium]|nr:(2Fe-2S)-binding protein [Deltaproteobacteria bacterium]MBW1942704.1 (2Fe-2S)-binding protein [Deltaproteobacteria bacterium]MBW2205839.1 (2Fe-2S)-binding protein [Deltaproteobacteria bacterium]MBW2284381.1 (2Fe-2S)-binding protein [Deltaproteobacteria bacterium]